MIITQSHKAIQIKLAAYPIYIITRGWDESNIIEKEVHRWDKDYLKAWYLEVFQDGNVW